MQVHSARFLGAASDAAQLPRHPWPEIAFAGRSNSGKSSLLNRLAGLNDALVFVDLPGYGFARVPLAIKLQWRDLVEGYLTRRPALRAVVLIADLRRALEEDDHLLLELLAAHGIPSVLAATKSDKLNRNDRTRQLATVRSLTHLDPHLVSSHTGEGIESLWAAIERAARQRASQPRGPS
jgi:GTP-binding protein